MQKIRHKHPVFFFFFNGWRASAVFFSFLSLARVYTRIYIVVIHIFCPTPSAPTPPSDRLALLYNRLRISEMLSKRDKIKTMRRNQTSVCPSRTQIRAQGGGVGVGCSDVQHPKPSQIPIENQTLTIAGCRGC